MESIERNLKEICHRKGLSLTDVANRMGTSPSNLLSSVKGNPTISKIQDIANALQVSVPELLTKRPEKAQGIAFIEGKTFQLSMPAPSTVKLPYYDNYKKLQADLRLFIKKSLKGNSDSSIMGMVEALKVFALIHNPDDEKFHLSICYADGKTLTKTYDKSYYAFKSKGSPEDAQEWDIDYLMEDIFSDVGEAVQPLIVADSVQKNIW